MILEGVQLARLLDSLNVFNAPIQFHQNPLPFGPGIPLLKLFI
jgi:hypothetical protein